MKLALEKQKLKEEADKHSKVAQKEKIRQEYQRALHERVTKQVCNGLSAGIAKLFVS